MTWTVTRLVVVVVVLVVVGTFGGGDAVNAQPRHGHITRIVNGRPAIAVSVPVPVDHPEIDRAVCPISLGVHGPCVWLSAISEDRVVEFMLQRPCRGQDEIVSVTVRVAMMGVEIRSDGGHLYDVRSPQRRIEGLRGRLSDETAIVLFEGVLPEKIRCEERR